MDKRIEGETREKEKYTRERIQVRESTHCIRMCKVCVNLKKSSTNT